MANSILFVTSSLRKVGEAKLACEPAGIEVIKRTLAINEIQSSSPLKISKDKARTAFAKLKKPLVVTDTFFDIPALNGFPGAYTKYVAEWFSPQDFIVLMSYKSDKTVHFTETITYIDSICIKVFSKRFTGKVIDSSRGTGNSIENVAEFNGVTLGERRQAGGFSHTADEYVWAAFADWYKSKNHVV